MRIDAKDNRCSFITAVYACFFISAFVFPVSVYAAGEIVAWGYNGDSQCTVPEPNTGFTAISAGGRHSLGLKADGSIIAWGYNWYGQCTVPEPNTGFKDIAAGRLHSLGLKQDGSIVAWGNNDFDQCVLPSPNTGFTAVATDGFHSLALKQDGSIVAWGYNGSGACDVPEPNTDFTAIAANVYHSLGLKTDGSIVAWGYNEDGQCNVPEPNTGFVAIAAGIFHSLGLKADGSIVAWGDNFDGQCNVPEPNTGFIAIAAGASHSLGLKGDGSIVAWGKNGNGQCNVPEPNTGFGAIDAGELFSLGLKGCPFNLVGDFSNDCNVDFEDLTILTDQWLQPPGTPSADIAPPPSGDGIANFLDYAMMANNWLVDYTLTYSLEPYVMALNETTEKIRLETNYATSVLINYGETSSYGKSVYDANSNTIHEMTLSPLVPGKQYCFEVIAVVNETAEKVEFHSSFVTSDNSKTKFRFGYFGDSRGTNCGDVGDGNSGKTAYKSMLEQMVKKGVEFVILGGDGVQTELCPNNSETYDSAWKNFHVSSAPLRDVNLSIPYLSALGNHELGVNYSQVGKDAFARYWMHPRNGAGIANNWEETTFWWGYGNTKFIFLNTEENGYGGRIVGAQLEWFKNEVNDANFDNKFVICHRALVGSIRDVNYGYGALQGLDPSMSAYIDNLMYDNNVTAGLYSHEHYYSYITTHDGKMPHIISGGAGAVIRNCCRFVPDVCSFGTEPNISTISEVYCDPNKNCTWHYIIVDVDGNAMDANVYDYTGNTILHSFHKESD